MNSFIAIKSLIKQSGIVTFVSIRILWGDTTFVSRFWFNSLSGLRFELCNVLSAEKCKRV